MAKFCAGILRTGWPRWRPLAILLAGWAGLVAPGLAQPAPPAVLVAAAQLRDTSPTAEFVGRVKAVDKVDLRARVSGYLGSRLFKEGDRVSQGQTVFTLDPAPFKAVLDQRKAEVAAATAALTYADLQARRGRELIKTKTIPQKSSTSANQCCLRTAPRSTKPMPRPRRPRSICPTPRSRARSPAASARPPSHPATSSARTAAPWRP